MSIGSGGSILSAPVTYQIPSDIGWLAQSLNDTSQCSGGTIPTAGVLTGAICKMPYGGGTIRNIEFYVTAAGATLTAGQCFATIHEDSSGVLLGSVDISGAGVLDAIGRKSVALGTSVVRGLASGPIRVSMFWNGTTGPTLLRGSSVSGGAANIGRTTPRYYTADSGLTVTVPNPMGAMTNNAACYLFGVS